MLVELIIVAGIIALVGVIVIALFVSRFLLICHPNEVIILSGRSRKLKDGTIVGYRIIRGGRALRIPILEKAARMSLEAIPLELTITNAYSKGGIPLHVDAIANIKINSMEPIFGNAVERLLDKDVDEIYKIAKDTLEGNLRGVLATLTPEEVNEDRLKFAQALMEEADNDLSQLGLQLDTLKVQNVADEAGYLDSIGRRKTAEVLSAARKAEAEKKAEAEAAEAVATQKAEIAKAESDKAIKAAQAIADAGVRMAEAEQEAAAKEAEARSRERADVAKANADQAIRDAQIEANRKVQTARAIAEQEIEIENNNLRLKKAELEKEAIIREKEALVAGEQAQARFEQDMEAERILLQQKRLTADVIEPAKAEKMAMELKAKGDAAPILEEGYAQLNVMREMVATYQSANGEGEKIFMLNMLPQILKEISDTVQKVNIDRVSIIDTGSGNGNGSGSGISRYVNQLPATLISLTEQIENATGVNILSQFQKGMGGTAPGPNKSTASGKSGKPDIPEAKIVQVPEENQPSPAPTGRPAQ